MADDKPSGHHGGSMDPSSAASTAQWSQSDATPALRSSVEASHPTGTPQTLDGVNNMSSLVAALPSDLSPNYGQRYSGGMQAAAMRQMPQYSAQAVQAQMPMYQGYPQNSSQAASSGPFSPYIDHQGMAMPYGHHHTMQGHYGPSGVYGSPQASPQYAGFPQGYGMPGHVQHHSFQGPPRMYSQDYNPSGQFGAPSGARQTYASVPGRSGSSPSGTSAPSTPRGPPRKPKQSGHALWVGNLPPGTQVSDLKDHFSRDATRDIESVFLISKSNCAFVNYKSEAACSAAMSRFHDSRFQGVRLVCRLRKGPGSIPSPSGGNANAPSGPAALQGGSVQSQSAVDAITQNRESSAKASEAAGTSEGSANDKYFIVKSLTIEDLELSARNGIWATQGHNEDALNKAYDAVENVYLIFSANKSGEYFGYARMESAIDDETAKTLEWKPFEELKTAEVAADPELPRSIPTPVTEFAPKGRIIDDSARGTIFWEADSDDENKDDPLVQTDAVVANEEKGENESSEGESDETDKESPDRAEADAVGESSHQAFGRPFRVRWVCTNKLPFYRTRGLRNPWNANREVKIARDGTELETSVGRRLIAMFHRAPGTQQQQQQPPQQQSQQQQIQNAQMQSQQQAFMGQLPPHMAYGMGPMSPGRY